VRNVRQSDGPPKFRCGRSGRIRTQKCPMVLRSTLPRSRRLGQLPPSGSARFQPRTIPPQQQLAAGGGFGPVLRIWPVLGATFSLAVSGHTVPEPVRVQELRDPAGGRVVRCPFRRATATAWRRAWFSQPPSGNAALIRNPHADARGMFTSASSRSTGVTAAPTGSHRDRLGAVTNVTICIYREYEFFVPQRISKCRATVRAREARGMP
jgi:hypothetical protein